MVLGNRPEIDRLNRGKVRSRPPFGFSPQAWPFMQILAAAGVSSTVYYAALDLMSDWQPQSWEIADRLALLLKCSVLTTFPFIAAVIVVAAQRLNPRYLEGKGVKRDSALDINSRVAQNSLEQFVLYFVGLGAMALYLTPKDAQTVPILATLFFIGRVLYWWGYHHNTYVRAFGWGLTFYPTVIVYAWLALIMSTGLYFPI